MKNCQEHIQDLKGLTEIQSSRRATAPNQKPSSSSSQVLQPSASAFGFFARHKWKATVATGGGLGLAAGGGIKGALVMGWLTFAGFGLIANPIAATAVFLAITIAIGVVAAVAGVAAISYVHNKISNCYAASAA